MKSSATMAKNPTVAAVRMLTPNSALGSLSSRARASRGRRDDSRADDSSANDSWAFDSRRESKGVGGSVAPAARTGLFSGSSTRDNRVYDLLRNRRHA